MMVKVEMGGSFIKRYEQTKTNDSNFMIGREEWSGVGNCLNKGIF